MSIRDTGYGNGSRINGIRFHDLIQFGSDVEQWS